MVETIKLHIESFNLKHFDTANRVVEGGQIESSVKIGLKAIVNQFLSLKIDFRTESDVSIRPSLIHLGSI